MVFCDNCGHTLKPTSKFCAKCGTKIDEMPEKEKPSISQEDFIKKYYGDKIFDRISEILKSSEIGDEDILFSISKKLKKKKEIDADDIQYLMGCSEELDEKETELPTNKEKPSISQDTGQPTTESKDWKVRKTQPDETDTPYEAVMRENYGQTKKQSGRFKKFAIGCGLFVVALVILAGFGSSNTEPMSDVTYEPDSVTTPVDIPPKYQPSENPIIHELPEKEFDPLLVAEAKKSIPVMQDLAKLVLKECRDVNSYSDYLIFVTVVTSKSERLLENLKGIDEILTIYELKGYDEHPEVGPLIKETRNLFMKTGICIDDVAMIYGN